jgi:hypothetical protein
MSDQLGQTQRVANRHEDLLLKHKAGSFVTAKPVPPTPIASYDRNV